MKRKSRTAGAARPRGSAAAGATPERPGAGGAADNRRGSPDAVEKRRAARRFNELLLGGGRPPDGRTERRRRRLLEELSEGVSRRGRRALKPIDVLSRVEALLALGEPLASIRKACPPPRPVEVTPELLDGIRRLHRAYGFSADAYRFVGLDARALRKAGVAPDAPALRKAVAVAEGAAPSAREIPGRALRKAGGVVEGAAPPAPKPPLRAPRAF